LSEADYDKLKSALHVLAAMLVRPRSTEKTSSVLEETAEAAGARQPNPDTPTPGHGRNAAEAFGGARKIAISHQQLKHGDRCPECEKGNMYEQKEPKTLVRIAGQAPLAATVYSRTAALRGVRASVHGKGARRRRPREVRRDSRGDDRAAQVR
jgi:hypothetical protein